MWKESSQNLSGFIILVGLFELVCSRHVRHVDLCKPGQVESHSERRDSNVQIHHDGDNGCSNDEQHIKMGDNRGFATRMSLAEEGALDIVESWLIIKNIVPHLQKDTTEHCCWNQPNQRLECNHLNDGKD